MSRRHPQPPIRHAQYELDNARSRATKGDRIAAKPLTLARLHRWLTDGYALEAPARLHDRDVADDGAPDHTGEAKQWLGMTQQREPNDWRAVASRLDVDGFYVTPMRAALSRIPGERGQFLAALACNVLTPLDVTRAYDIADWCASDVMYRSLSMLWDQYQDRPIARRGPRSEAQLDAEAAA